MKLLVDVVVSEVTARQLLRTWGAICVLQKLKSVKTDYLNFLDSVSTTSHCPFIFLSVTEFTPRTYKSLWYYLYNLSNSIHHIDYFLLLDL